MKSTARGQGQLSAECAERAAGTDGRLAQETLPAGRLLGSESLFESSESESLSRNDSRASDVRGCSAMPMHSSRTPLRPRIALLQI